MPRSSSAFTAAESFGDRLERHRSWLLAVLCSALVIAVLPRGARAEDKPEPTPWCAPELEVIQDGVCAFTPAPTASKERTLVIFLHSLVGVGSSWAWEQQRLMTKMAKAYGLGALIPRGRPGFGPGRDPKVIAWPTAKELQDQHEATLVAEWTAARQKLEQRTGKFDKVLVFGFSNGAYYATSLALRGRLADVDGYGVFAGGSGGKYSRLLAASTERKVPIFVGYGTLDKAHPAQRELGKLLHELRWPHRVKAERIGHTVSDSQIRGALQFLGAAAEDAR
jgi:dienelactone hydrolase